MDSASEISEIKKNVLTLRNIANALLDKIERFENQTVSIPNKRESKAIEREADILSRIITKRRKPQHS